MNLRQFFAILKASAWTIILMTVVGTGVAWVLASTIPRVYSAKARVMLNVGSTDPNHMSALDEDSQASYINTQMRLVTDIAVARDVVEKLGWPSDPQVVAVWQATTGGAGDVETWVAQALTSNIGVRRLENSAIIEIYYSAPSVDIAKQIAATIRTAFIDNSQRVRSTAARRASAWNVTVAARALVDLKNAEAKRVKFVAANNIPVDSSSGSLETLELEASRKGSIDVSTLTEAPAKSPANSFRVAQLRSELAEIDLEVELLKQRGSDNPDALAAVVQRNQVAAQLARETSLAQAGAAVMAAQAEASRRFRGNQYLSAKLRILDRAPVYDQLAQIDREISLKKALYQSAAERVANFDQIAAAPSGMSIIGDTIADDDPVYPNLPLTVGLAAGASFGLGIAIALLGETLRRMVRGAEDLQFYSRVPVLAVIAANPPLRRRRWGFSRVPA